MDVATRTPSLRDAIADRLRDPEDEAARGTPFDRAERARLDAGAIYAPAYTSRCEVGHSGEGGMCAELRAGPDAYFSG